MNFIKRWLNGKKTISKNKLFPPILNQSISKSLAINLDILKQIFSHSPDLVIRHIQLKTGNNALLVYLDGLTDKVAIENHILHPLFHELDSIKNIESSITIGKTETVTLWLDN